MVNHARVIACDHTYVVALDVGGTSVKSAVVGKNGLLLRDVLTTPINSRGAAAEILDTLAAIIKGHLQTLTGKPLLGVAIGFPGPFAYDTGVSLIQGVDKYEAIYGLNIGQELQGRLDLHNCPIRFCNDATAAIIGEARYGAGRPFTRVIGITLGTGCGSAFLIDGVPVSSGAGVPPEGVLYQVLFEGRWADDVFSIRGLLRALAEGGVHVEDTRRAAVMAQNGHEQAQRTFARFGRDLGLFLGPWVDNFQADVVLIGGGIARAYDLFGAEIAAGLPVPVLHNNLGAEAALLGVAALFNVSDPAV